MKIFKYLFFLTTFSIIIFSAMPMKSFKWTKGYDDYTTYDEEINSLRTLLQSLNIRSNTQEPFNFLELPEEMQQKIASFLSGKNLYHLSHTNRSVRNTLLQPSPFAKTNELNKIIAASLIYNFIINSKVIFFFFLF